MSGWIIGTFGMVNSKCVKRIYSEENPNTQKWKIIAKTDDGVVELYSFLEKDEVAIKLQDIARSMKSSHSKHK